MFLKIIKIHKLKDWLTNLQCKHFPITFLLYCWPLIKFRKCILLIVTHLFLIMHLEYKSLILNNKNYPGNVYDIFEGTDFSDIK